MNSQAMSNFVDTSKRFSYYRRMAKSPKVERHSFAQSLIPSFVNKGFKKFSKKAITDNTYGNDTNQTLSKTKFSFELENKSRSLN